MEDEGNVGFSWEEKYKKTWEYLQEDEHGSLHSIITNQQLDRLRKKRTLYKPQAVKKGIIRHLCLIIDLSSSSLEKDLSPSRIELVKTTLTAFFPEYFEQNPLSQLAIVVTFDGIAKHLSFLSGNLSDHEKAIKEFPDCKGEPSFQNSLEVALSILSYMNNLFYRKISGNTSKEIVFIHSSLSCCDPGNIYSTVQSLQKSSIRCSFISLSAEMKICREIAKSTLGSYKVCLNEVHFKDCLMEFLLPPSLVSAKATTDLIEMGFPTKVENINAFCSCHNTLASNGFICPNCKSLVCELPKDCPVCSLTLISSPHLARSFHHLFPIPAFIQTYHF